MRFSEKICKTMPPMGSFTVPHPSLPRPCPFPSRTLVFMAIPPSLLAISQCLLAQPIPWKSSVSEKIRVYSEGLLGYSLIGQKPASVRGILTLKAQRNPSTWEKWFVSLWHTHFQPCVTDAQAGPLIQLSL